MLKVGITGGIGSGKTLVSEIFSKLGIPVFYADLEAARLTRFDPEIKEGLKAIFGSRIIDPEGLLNRKILRDLVFSNGDARKKVNALIHPYVKIAFGKWCLLQENAPFLLKEAAILFESGSAIELNKVIGVFAPMEIRLNRVVLRDSVSKEQVESIMRNQMDEEEKMKLCDYVIYNDSTHMLIPQVLTLYSELRELSGKK